MTYLWLLFDADGTLFDYDRAEAQALVRTFEMTGFDWKPEYTAIYREINGGLWRAFEKGEISFPLFSYSYYPSQKTVISRAA